MDIIKKTNTHNTTASKGRSVDFIVIHYTAGTTSKAGSAANTAAYFSTTDRQASSAFIVDDEGIVQYNPDIANRYTWHCGGNRLSTKGGSFHGRAKNANSIGIEICSANRTGKVTDANGADWSFTDKALSNAAEFVRHLMAEYGISPDHVIRHYDVTGKLCPGIIGWNADSGDESKWTAFKSRITGTAAADDNGAMTDAEMYAYFKSCGLNDCGTAGLMGNLYAESGLASDNLQNTGNAKLSMTDGEYTAAVDNGTYTNFVKDGFGYGLAQWTFWSRKQAFLEFMRAAGVSIGNKRKQCEFLMKELPGYTAVFKVLKAASSVREASDAVLTGFEKPADQSDAVKAKRAGFGQMFYDRYAAENPAAPEMPAAEFTPYRVQVKITNLNIRKGPGTDYAKTGQYTGKGVFTIVGESAGAGSAKGWGKLKSGAGWIALDHVNKI